MNKTKVLLIDDEKGVTAIMKMNLEKTGDFEVETVNESSLALKTGERFLPDIIILDMVMPGLDGGDVMRLFRESAALREIPILFLTALVSHSDTSPDTHVVQAGSDLMIPKPVSTELLMRCIKSRLAGEI